MKTAQLTTWERITLLGCIPPTCPLVEIPKYLRIIEILTMTEAEEKLVSLTRLPNGNRTWTNTKHLFTLDFENSEFRFLLQLTGAREQWPIAKESLQLTDKLEDIAAQPAVEEKREKAD